MSRRLQSSSAIVKRRQVQQRMLVHFSISDEAEFNDCSCTWDNFLTCRIPESDSCGTGPMNVMLVSSHRVRMPIDNCAREHSMSK